MKKAANRGKRSKTLSEVNPIENINKIPQSFLGISPMKKEVFLSHKLQDHAYEYQTPFGVREGNPSQRNYQNQLSHLGLSHTEQKSQKSFIQGKICIQQNLNEGLKYL